MRISLLSPPRREESLVGAIILRQLRWAVATLASLLLGGCTPGTPTRVLPPANSHTPTAWLATPGSPAKRRALISAGSRRQGAAMARIWDPLQKQELEPDTLFLLDIEQEHRLRQRQLHPGAGSFIPAQSHATSPWPGLVSVPGKFRRGLKCLDRDNGYLWMPSLGLIDPQQFTIEAWFRCDRPWAEVYKNWPLLLRDDSGAVDLHLCVHDGWLTLGYRHLQDPAGPVQAQIHYDLLERPLPARIWVNLAVTFAQGVLKLYVNGAPAGAATKLSPPAVWSDCANYDGLCLLGAYGRGADQFALSDLRISGQARVPGQLPVTGNPRTLSVDLQAPTGQIVNRNLLGSLHYLQGPQTERMAAGALTVMRTDKLLSTTPIRAGAPDSLHPARGVSGCYAYDWQVVDRTLDYYRRLHVMPYLSIDATPQLLGGSVPPLRGVNLATRKSGETDFPGQVPRDLPAFGTMVRDLVYHVVKERHDHVRYWGVWNEPDGGHFWDGRLDHYLALYDVCARAVKAVDPRLQVGGPETGYDPRWLEPLIQHCAAGHVPLDFVSWHYYSGNIGELPRARAQVDSWCHGHGLGTGLPLIVGEWCGPGEYPLWAQPGYALSDRHAAFVGASLVAMQRARVALSIYTVPVTNAVNSGAAAGGLMAATHPWASLNVFRLWSRQASRLVRAQYDGWPGVLVQAARDAHRITIFLARAGYRKGEPGPLEIHLTGLPPHVRPTKVTDYVVDARHADAWDAGLRHAELETEPCRLLRPDTLRITVRPCSVHLVVADLGATP